MSYFLPDAAPLTVQEDSPVYGSPKNTALIKEFTSETGVLYKLTVQARDWKKISATERFSEAVVPEIDDTLVKHGLVIIYIFESGRTVSLPFTYYQAKRAMSFQPSYESGRVYITILGDFILNPHIHYTFRILLVNGKTLKHYKKLNWYNFDEALKAITG